MQVAVVRRTPIESMRLVNDPCFNRICVDVVYDSKQFVLIAYPVIVRFVLPECPFAFQDAICLMRRIAFQAVHDSRKWASRIVALAAWLRFTFRLARQFDAQRLLRAVGLVS